MGAFLRDLRLGTNLDPAFVVEGLGRLGSLNQNALENKPKLKVPETTKITYTLTL